MLAIGEPGVLRWDGGTAPLRVPGDHERLVGTTGAAPTQLFAGDRIVAVRLDPADPLPGPAAAWEVLDAVVLEPAAMAALGEGRRATLLGGGVTLAVTGDVPPDGRWVRRGAVWVLSRAPAGPTGAVAEGAYAPTETWTPGWPASVGRTAVGVGVGTCMLTLLAVALAGAGSPQGRRRYLSVAVAIPLLSTVGILIWRAKLDPIAYGGGDVTVVHDGWRQRDAWVYERARMDADVTVPWKGWAHPIFAADDSVDACRPRLTVAADGSMAFTLHLAAGHTMAFVRRDVGPGEAPPITGELGAPMRGIAPLYLSTGDRVIGETAPPPGRWAGVLIGRR